MTAQIPLGITLRESTSFDTFHPGDNGLLLSQLRTGAEGKGEPFIFFWGIPGSGKSHLLQATCRLAAGRDRTTAYIPLSESAEFHPEILSDLEHLDLVCIDDLQQIAGQSTWEQALFRLFNQLRDGGSQLLISADRSPAQLPIGLPDLRSRLKWGASYQLQPLDDEARMEALIASAGQRGMSLPPEAAGYIIRHTARDMDSLKRLLEDLDQASLAAQRRLTVPFVKTLLK